MHAQSTLDKDRRMDIVKQAMKNLSRTATVGPSRLTYRDLLLSSDRISQSIHKSNGGSGHDNQPPRVGLYASPGPEYLAASMGVSHVVRRP